MKNINKIFIYLPNLNGGGAEKVYINLANQWIIQGINVTFILNKKTGPYLTIINKKIKIINLNINKIRNSFFMIPKIIKKENPEIFIAPMWPITSLAIIIFKLFFLKTKLIISDHVNLNKSIKNETNFNFFFFKYILKFTYPFCDGMIAVSEGVKNNIIELTNNKNFDIQVINNPVIEDKSFNNLKYYKTFPKNKNFTFISVGTLKKQKNHNLLIDAFSFISKKYDCRLVILGNGPEEKVIKKLIKEKNLQLKIIMKDFDIEIEKHYLSSHVLVLSSDWEGFGNVLVEALHYGLRIISTNCNYGPAEILKNGKYGVLTKVGDAKLLSLEMERMITNNYINFDHKNHERSKDFCVSIISKKYLEYFEKVI